MRDERDLEDILEGLFESMTLQEARQLVQRNIESGIVCPCCRKYARAYSRNFNGTMAKGLIWLVQQWSIHQTWIDVPKTAPRWLVRSNQLPTVRWWGLAKRPAESRNSTLKHSGLWEPTQKGIDFVLKKIKIPLQARTYDGKVTDLVGKEVSIVDTLGIKFDYLQLMGWYNPDRGWEE
jgi:hypothetical protein